MAALDFRIAHFRTMGCLLVMLLAVVSTVRLRTVFRLVV